MATSDGFGPRVLRYLESARNLVGCAGGAVGLGLHFAGLGGVWWPGVVVGLYGVGALLTPAPRPREGAGIGPGPGAGAGIGTGTGTGTGAGTALGGAEASGAHSPEGAHPPEGAPAHGRGEPERGEPRPPAPGRPPAPDPELVALAAYLDSVPLPPSAGVDGLLAALRAAGPGPVAERIVRHRLPVAVAGYLRARTWQPWAGPDDPDPALRLGHEVDRLMGELS
ncbi:hypothetical protein ACFVUY_16860 [Kitasatospora sp. NPDC058063]|uniref:hypothetical protein n=1 Tax=unclassified Kitasatospora TaxID=2633591 RepID=UPI0036DABB2E